MKWWGWFHPVLDRPTFLVGCGRSGTTIAGRMLGRHPLVTYLNEPRELWARCVPASDVWSRDAGRRGGRLVLEAADATVAVSHALRCAFARQTARNGRPRLVEKLPINAFRLPFLAAALPEARFLVIVRDGVAVARSIARFAAGQPWFGFDDYKWRALSAHAEARSATRGLPELCTDGFSRGLLEWRLSVEAAIAFVEGPGCDRSYVVRYEDLLREPRRTLGSVLAFLNLPPSPEVDGFAVTEIARQPLSELDAPLGSTGDRIAGPLLARLGYARRF